MGGDSSNRRHFLKAVGLMTVSGVLPVGLSAEVAWAATPSSLSSGAGALELWLLDTGVASLDAGLHEFARQNIVDAVAFRGEVLPY